MRYRSKTAALPFALGLLLAACGTSTGSDRFQQIEKADVAAAFKEVATTTTTTTPPRPSSSTTTTTVAPTTLPPTTAATTTVPSENVVVYFVTADGRLKAVTQRRPLPVQPLDAITELQTPPAANLRTYIAAGLVVSINQTLYDGVPYAAVHLQPSFLERPKNEQVLIAAQLTLTLTQLRGIALAGIVVNGDLLQMPVPGTNDSSALLGSQAAFSAMIAP
jgi:Sporulation and spore germination